jgi:hypothetical protein
MKTILVTFFTTVLITIGYHPSVAQSPFTATTSLSSPPSFLPCTNLSGNEPLRILSFNGSVNGDKVLLDWTVIQNQDALQFEVERSFDGKNFNMIALVFCSDKPDTAQYKFFEKATSKIASYRIRIIHKDKTIEYSAVIVIQELMTKTSTL